MAGHEKLVDAQYTGPDGSVHTFLWETLEKETELKTGIFTFPDVGGAKIQHSGQGVRTFPLHCIFNGVDCALRADAFEAALIKSGIGKLLHPLYGLANVVPTGSIKRKDDLVKGFGESLVSVSFAETIIDGEYPSAVTAGMSDIDANLEKFSEELSAEFARGLETPTITEQLNVQTLLNNNSLSVKGKLENLTKSKTAFQQIFGELKNNIKGMFSDIEKKVVKAIDVSHQVLALMRLPSKVAIDIMAKISGYGLLISGIISQYKNDPFGAKNITNQFYNNKLILEGAIANLAVGVAQNVSDKNQSVNSREKAVMSSVLLLNMFENIKEFENSRVEQNVFIDSNTSFITLTKLVYDSVHIILNTAFELPVKRTITLDRDRQLVELAAELYGNVENKTIDRVINENNLNCNEILLLPMGREVSYYVQSA